MSVVAPLFSVVIPAWNRSETIAQALESVQAQTDKDFEVIVVDDGSSDSTAQVAESFGVKVLRQSNAGPGAARNLRARHATGEYLVFLDSDDLWFPWTLSVYRAAIADRTAVFVAGHTVEFSEIAELQHVTYEEPTLENFECFIKATKDGYFVGSNSMCIRRDLFETIGGFTTAITSAEDHDLALRLCITPGFCAVRSPVTIAYRRHERSITSLNNLNVAGMEYLIDGELDGRYPGARNFRVQRLNFISARVRPASLSCLSERRFAKAWRLFARMLLWNLKLWRIRYLLYFPVRFLAALATPPK